MAAENNTLRGEAVMVVNAGEPSNPPYGFRYRKGAQKDWDNMSSVLVADLGFRMLNEERRLAYNVPLSRWDHTRARVVQGRGQQPSSDINPPSETCCLKCLIKHHDFSSASCFVFYISSHGRQERGVLSVQFLSDYDNTNDTVTVKEIVRTLSDESNGTLAGKPRILIIQGCRDDDMHLDLGDDKGVEVKVAGTVDTDAGLQLGQSFGDDENNAMGGDPGDARPPPPVPRIFPDVPTVDIKLPRHFLLVFPTTPYRTSKRNTEQGSWFEYHLKEALDEYTEPVVDFLELITLTANKVAARSSVVYMQGGWTDAHGRRMKDPFLSGMKNAVCVEHRLCQPLMFRKVARQEEPMDEQPAL